MKFLVPTKLKLPAEPLTMWLLPPDPRSLCPLSSTEFVEPPPWTKFLGTPLRGTLCEAWGWSELYIKTSFILTVNSVRFRLKATMLILFMEVVIVNCECRTKTHYSAVGKCRVLFMLKTIVHGLNKVIAFCFNRNFPWIHVNELPRLISVTTSVIFILWPSGWGHQIDTSKRVPSERWWLPTRRP
jgi:hypothetical protein